MTGRMTRDEEAQGGNILRINMEIGGGRGGWGNVYLGNSKEKQRYINGTSGDGKIFITENYSRLLRDEDTRRGYILSTKKERDREN